MLGPRSKEASAKSPHLCLHHTFTSLVWSLWREEKRIQKWIHHYSFKTVLRNLCSHSQVKENVFTMWLVKKTSVQLLSRVRLFVTPWIAAHQASLSITNSQSLPQPMSIELVMPSNHLIICHLLLLLPPVLPNIRVFSNESTLCMR